MVHHCLRFLSARPAERLEALYDCLAPFYFLLHPFVKAIASRAVLLLQDGHGLCALDVCTGTGVVAEALAGRGYRVVGIDISDQMLSQRRAFRRERAITHARMDARQLAFADRSFDLCSISMGLHEFDPGDRRRILREMSRVSRRHVLVADYSGPQPWFVGLAEWIEGSHYHDLVWNDMGEQIERAGLRIIEQARHASIALYLCLVPD